MQKLILASSSKQRKMVMDSLGIPYEIIPADLDEKAIQDPDPLKRVEILARAKAEKIGALHNGVIIGADTFDVLGTRVLEKPQTIEKAKEMLRAQSGNSATAYTGVCYLDQKNKSDFSTACKIQYTFRKLSEEEIELYVKKFAVTTWAAAFSPAYVYSASMIEKIDGSFNGFIYGFPVEIIAPLLVKSGFKINPQNI